MVSIIKKLPKTQRYSENIYRPDRRFHEIYVKGDENEYKRGIKKAMDVSYGGAFLILSNNSDHFHVVHDCSYSDRRS